MSAQQVNLDPSKVLRFVQVSSAFGKKALDEVMEARKAQKQAAAIRPQILQVLSDTGVIAPHQKQAADQALQSHVQTMNLLKNAVTKLAEFGKAKKEAGDRLGAGVDNGKTAAAEYDSLKSPFVGERTSKKKASDRALLSGLGLPTD